MTDDASPLFEECAHCGAPFEPDTRYPAIMDSDEDGNLSVFSFCDEECQSAWAADD